MRLLLASRSQINPSRSSNSKLYLHSNFAMMSRMLCCAMCLPIHALLPIKKGRLADLLSPSNLLCSAPSNHLSGRKSAGSAKYSGDLWIVYKSAETIVPAGMKVPAIVQDGAVRCAVLPFAGGIKRKVSRMQAFRNGKRASRLPVISASFAKAERISEHSLL